MKFVSRIVAMLALVLVSSFSAVAQSTPEAVADEMTPFAFGLDSPATFIDQRGNPVFSIVVTGIERDWQSPSDFDTPQAGMEYVQLQLAVTNHGARAGVLSPYTVLMLDSMGAVMYLGYIYDQPDIWIDDVTVPAGETVEGSIVFEMYADLEPMTVLWQPEYTTYVIIYLGDE